MPTEPVELARNTWGVILHHPDWRTVELKWLPTTRQMTDDGFKATLEMLASAGEHAQPLSMLIDAVEFHHQFGEGVLDWRDTHIIPRYNAAGVTKFAFVMGEGAAGTVEAGTAPSVAGSATFPTGWFQTRARAYQWLAEPAPASEPPRPAASQAGD